MIGKNNPLNVRYSRLNRWKGQTGQRKGFCEFSDVKYGIRAALYLLWKSYPKKGLLTYSEIISAYAPATENDTQKYIKFVTESMDVFPFDMPVLANDFCWMLHYMSIFEGNEVSFSDCYKVFCEFFKR